MNTILQKYLVIALLALLFPTIGNSQSWAVRMADSEMKRFPQSWMLDHSTSPKWGYSQGLGCKAMLEVWKKTGQQKYFDYAKSYADTMITTQGKINTYKTEDYNIDHLNAGKILFDLYAASKELKYKTAIETLRDQMRTHPRTSEGGFWHKQRYPSQMWLDGIFMGSPFLAQYAKEFNEPALFDEVINQITLIAKHTYDEKTGLFYHAWDESRQQKWADPVTGRSPGFWGRSIGWYAMALVDVLDFIPENHPRRNEVIAVLDKLASGIVNYQDSKTGLWYQVPDQGSRKGNYLEASCSSMFAYALAKGANRHYLAAKYKKAAEKAFKGLLKTLIRIEADGSASLTQCCAVAGLGGTPNRDGSYEYYIGEMIRDNDAKATGPFIMAAIELNK